jgi:hypothetical protein
MNMKKTIAAVAATALAISAIAVPVSAEVPGAVADGRTFTYNLTKTAKVIDGDPFVDVVSQSDIINLTNGFSVSLDGIDTTKDIEVTIISTTATVNYRETYTLRLTGDDRNVLPAGFTYVTDADVLTDSNDGGTDAQDAAAIADGLLDGTTDDFLTFIPATSNGVTTASVIVKGTVKIPRATVGTNYKNLANATDYVNNSTTALSFTNYIEVVAGASTLASAGNGVYDPLYYAPAGLASNVVPVSKTTANLVKPQVKEIKMPYKSTTNATTANGTYDIIRWLAGEDNYVKVNANLITGSEDNGLITLDPTPVLSGKYNNVAAVLNDCITNYDNVVFTFKTATDNVVLGGAFDGFYATGTGEDGVDTYKKFDQNTYNLYGDDGTNAYAPFDTGIYWQPFVDFGVAYNLFSGALIINDNITMQLADTQVFDYGQSTLSFDYEAIKTYGNLNPYVNLIWSMKLATSVDWYWDALEVSFTPATNDSGESEAPAIEDDEPIADEPTEDVPSDELPEVLPEEPAADPVAPAANPGTGNAPIALAVIPVALAAAAIIAKKRK